MTHLYLIRHADYIYDLVDGQYPKCDQGLSPEGVKQVERLRDRLASSGEIRPDVFIASPERRAHETAKMLEPVLNVPIILDKDVEEWRSDDGSLSEEEFNGQWNALTPAQKPYHHWIAGFESLLEFSLRVHVTLNRILTAHEGKTILILSHGAFIQTTFAYFFGYSLAIPPRAMPEIRLTSITHWISSADGTRWTLERSNDCQHMAAGS